MQLKPLPRTKFYDDESEIAQGYRLVSVESLGKIVKKIHTHGPCASGKRVDFNHYAIKTLFCIVLRIMPENMKPNSRTTNLSGFELEN